MSRTQVGNDLRRKILEEAIGIVYSEGTDKITMRALGDRLGYSPATIYLYFRNKDELLLEIARSGFESLAERCLPALRSEDVLGGLRESAKAYLDFALENPALYQLMFRVLRPAREEPELMPLARSMNEARLALLRRGVEQGVIRVDDPDLAGALHTCALHGFADLTLSGRNPVPFSERENKALRDQFAEALVGNLARPH